MKKILLSLVIINLLILPLAAFGADEDLIVDLGDDVQILGEGGAADKIINILFTALLIAAAIFIVIAAFNFLGSQGDPGKVELARNMVLYALIAVMVALVAKGLVWLVTNYIGNQNITPPL